MPLLPLACIGLCLATLARQVVAGDPVDYLREVKPILTRHCFTCHGALKQESGLRLDAAGLISEGGDRGPAIAAGNPGESLLMAAVRGTGDVSRMPYEGEPLSAEEIGKLEAWIGQGAQAPAEAVPEDPRLHWAFQVPNRPSVPRFDDRPDLANPIDAFLEAARRENGLSANPPADKRVMLRRVYFDLIGLPLTESELAAFLADDSPDAYSRVVDRLLASPRHGERWGRHWMDVWRYADWAGYGDEIRESQRHIWKWRDWIVDSLNEDAAYDRMIVHMLAGDELAPGDPKTLVATGFLARNWFKFNRNVWIDNAIEHTSKAFLGVTLNCARCHDHMYDPISQREYYAFRALFEPHAVRTDRLPGQPNLNLDGLPRVYDGEPAAPTYLFVRGNDSQPDKEHPLAPAVPDALGGPPLLIQPVALPVESYYPGIRPFVHAEALKSARMVVDQARAEAQKAHESLAALVAAAAPPSVPSDGTMPEQEPAEPPPPPPDELARKAAECQAAKTDKAVESAEASLAAVQARIAADRARFASPAADASVIEALVASAARLEKSASLKSLELAVVAADAELAAARAAPPADESKGKEAVAAAEKKVAEATKAFEEARNKPDPEKSDYSLFDTLYPKESTGRRLGLARWIASRNNPLVARVAVNHVWMRHFGEPLVPSVFDFGRNGKPPSHPELLDWLAVEFMDQGWNFKWLHRLMVESRAYRQSSHWLPGDPRAASDPENRFLWRMNSHRLEGEIVRDAALSVAGRLDPMMGGADLDQNLGLTSARRSLYFRHAHEKQMVFLTIFDAPNVTECYRRSESIVPHQALAMANSSLVLEQARRLAGELSAAGSGGEGADQDCRFVQAAFQRVLGRPATDEEESESASFLASQRQLLAGEAGPLVAFPSGASPAVAPAADPAQRAREGLVLVLFNHHEFLTVR